MRNYQIKFKKIRQNFVSSFVLAGVVGVLVLPVLLQPIPAKAQGIDVSVFSSKEFKAYVKETKRKEFWDKLQKQLKTAGAVAFKNSLHFFLNTLAYDTATWMASGGEGQQPMFYTEGWGEYLTNLADGAAGTFLEGIGDGFGGINVCNPSSLDLKISLGIAIADVQRPRQPTCTASEIVNNWEAFATDTDFLQRITPIFDTRQNDIGIALTFFGEYYEKTLDETIAGIKKREEGDGVKSVTEKISDLVLTPGQLVRDQFTETLANGSKGETTFTGEILADAVDTFTQTLAGKLLQRLFREGLAALSGSGRSSSSSSRPDLSNPDGGGRTQDNVAAAQERFLSFLDAGIITGGPYEVLVKLSSCPDIDNPGPEECAIDQRLRLGIEQELTVREAIAQGYLNGNAPFGYIEKDVQPHYQEGYPYRSLLIMRAHRIIPVSWEVAAELANQYRPASLPVTLNELIAEFDVCGQNETKASIFCGLIDENWVLKAPEHICKAQGPGPIIVSDEYSAGQRITSRADYCADYQSCIDEDDSGNCRYFGYCVEERSTWNLNGESCQPEYNTCTTYQDSRGNTVSYLANTLDYNGCSADNAGCLWYCTQYNEVSDEWVCQFEDEIVLEACTNTGGCTVSADCPVALGQTTCFDTSNTPPTKLTLNEPCTEGSQYWNGTACLIDENDTQCTIPNGGVACQRTGCEVLPDLLANGSFEVQATSTGGLAQNWSEGLVPSLTYFERASGALEKILTGSNSLRFYGNTGSVSNGPVGSNVASSAVFNLPPGEYTFSGSVYNHLNLGNIEVAVTSQVGGTPTSVSRSSTIKNSWEKITFNFTGGPNTQVLITVTDDVSDQVNGLAWFDDFKITQSCVVNPVRLTLSDTDSIDQSKIHFDRDIQSCDPEAEGCSAFVRTLPNSGTNLVRNSSFDTWPNPLGAPSGWVSASAEFATTSPFDASSLLLSNSSVPVELTTEPIIGMKQQTSYQVSVFVKASLPIGATETSWEFLLIGDTGTANLVVNNSSEISLSTEWQRLVFDPVATGLGLNFRLGFANPSVGDTRQLYIDGVQVEEVATDDPIATNYKPYGASNVVHLKEAPAELNCTGDWLTDPDECNNYALYCQATEVGCESYRPVQGGISIPGVVGLQDYCPAECVGYDTFKQSTTYFESVEALEFFIPDTARQCSVSQVGCDEFTNLDEVALGGEGREYYKYLRQCELPDDPGVTCTSYFTWQGSEDSGFQLRVHNLSADPNTGEPLEAIAYDSNDPSSVTWPESWCSNKSDADNDGLPDCCDASDDSFNNPFCKEYIDIDGNFYYRLEPNTIQCSADCHPFRKTSYGEAATVAEANCVASNGDWDGVACIYQAIPKQGQSCSASGAGCREYRGNTGGNVFTALFDNFEDGDTIGWRIGNISTEALSLTGHSLASELTSVGGVLDQRVSTMVGSLTGGATCSDDSNITPVCNAATTVDCYNASLDRCVAADTATPNNETCLVEVGSTSCSIINDLLNPGREYIISFWAKSDNNPITGVMIELASANQTVAIAAANFDTEWNFYTFGPFSDSSLNGTSRLQMRTPSAASPESFFMDNLELKEIQDHAYVIKGSWNTPVSCDTNPFVDPAVASDQFMLGCKQYQDSGQRTHNLKQFTNLCREEAVGCEALLDTQNSNSPFAETFNINDAVSDVKVDQDRLVYLVNQTRYQCPANFEGCQAFGLPEIKVDTNNQEVVTDHSNVFLINDPDSYDTTLCSDEEVGCEEHKTNDGLSYFKNPGPRLCELRFVPSKGANLWFKVGSDGVDDLINDLCPTIQPPIGEAHPGYSGECSDNGAVCTSSNLNACGNPATAVCNKLANFVGTCPAGQNSCNLFVDPASNVAKNLLFNSDFNQDLDGPTGVGNGVPDGWQSAPDLLTQAVNLQAFTTYTLSFDGNYEALEGTNLEISLGQCSNNVELIPSYDRSMVATSTDPTPNSLFLPRSAYADDTRTGSGLPAIRQYSGRFSLTGDASCVLSVRLTGGTPAIKNLIGAVAVKETILNYSLSNSVDKFSCNGQVDPNQGCVLFNDRSAVNYKLGEDDTTYLLFDADVSGPNINNGAPLPNCSGACDTNAVLKAKPDRQCEQWLSCSTIVLEEGPDGTEIERCLNLVACDKLNDDGTCASTSNVEQAFNRTYYSTSNPDQLRTLSGYAKAGAKGISTTTPELNYSIEGYIPYHLMEQVGESAVLSNGNFEITVGETTQPTGWVVFIGSSYDSWADYKFSAGSTPALVKEGSRYLTLNTSYRAESEFTEVFGGSTYTVSGWINTVDLQPAAFDQSQTSYSYIMIAEYDYAGEPILSVDTACFNTPDRCVMRSPSGSTSYQIWNGLGLSAGASWTKVSQTFTTSPRTGRIKARLINTLGPNGDATLVTGKTYFDDLTISPLLQVQKNDLNPVNDFVARSCRLYPLQNAVSCDFFDEGVTHQGWKGYCITADPNNADACLQWWPVDQIRGEINDEITGYDGRSPLYYCAQAEAERMYEYRKAYYFGRVCGKTSNPCPANYDKEVQDASGRCGFLGLSGSKWHKWCIPKNDAKFPGLTPIKLDGSPDARARNNSTADAVTSGNDGWYPYDGQATPVKYYGSWGLNDPEPVDANGVPVVSGLYEKFKSQALCTTLVTAVTDQGKNKAWVARVGQGSNYTVPDLLFTYASYNLPFASVSPPNPFNDPASWQQLGFNATAEVNPGVPWSCVPLELNNCHPDVLMSDLNNPESPSPLPATAIGKDYEWAKDRLKRIFAQSYSIWDWQTITTANTCVISAAPVGVCLNDPSQDSNGNPTPRACSSHNACEGIHCRVSGPCPGNPAQTCMFCASSNSETSVCTSDSDCTYPGEEGGDTTPLCGLSQQAGICNNNGNSCVTDNDCGKLTTLRYSQDTTKTGWSVPTELCPDNSRTSIVTLIDEDFENWPGVASSTPPNYPPGWGYGNSGLTVCNGLCDPSIIRRSNDTSDGSNNSLLFINEGGSGDYDIVSPLMPLTPQDLVTFSVQARASVPVNSSVPPYKIYIALIRDDDPDFNPADTINHSRIYLDLYNDWRDYTYNLLAVPVAGNYRLSITSLNGFDEIAYNLDNIKVSSTLSANSLIDYCGVAPTITNIKVNATSTGVIEIHNAGNVNLEFNVDVDENQMPLKSYKVDWGDNSGVSFSGVNLRSKTNTRNQFSLNHYYDYWQIVSQYNQPQKSYKSYPIRCGTDSNLGPYCDVDIGIHVRDNWGWCNGSLDESGNPLVIPELSFTSEWGYFAGTSTYQWGNGVDNSSPLDGIVDNAGELDTLSFYTKPFPSAPGFIDKQIYDCDDLNSTTRFNPARGFNGAIRVYER